MRPPAAALAAGLAALAIGLTACGASKPAALPDDASFRSCLTHAGVSPDDLDSSSTRRAAFEDAAPWDCVLALSSADDRHAVLGGVFPPDGASLLKAVTAWIDTQDDDGTTIARHVGTLVAAADDPMPSDSAKASLRSDRDDEFQSVVSLAIYQQADGTLPGYTAYLARPDLKGDPSASNRYYQNMMDKGGTTADRLRSYAATIDALRDHLRAE